MPRMSAQQAVCLEHKRDWWEKKAEDTQTDHRCDYKKIRKEYQKLQMFSTKSNPEIK